MSAVGNCGYITVCLAAQGAHGGEEGRGHIVAAACLQLVKMHINFTITMSA